MAWAKALSAPFLLYYLSLERRLFNYSFNKYLVYLIYVSGLILVEDKGHDASIRDLLLCLDGQQIIDSACAISILMFCISFPENIKGVGCFLVVILAEVFQRIPVSFADVGKDLPFADLGFLLSGFWHLNSNKLYQNNLDPKSNLYEKNYPVGEEEIK